MEPHRLSSTEPLHSRTPNSHAWLDHGSGEMDHGLDLEAGVDRAGVPLANLSRSSLGRRSESDDEGGGDGEEDGGDEEGDWNERHPCFPHPNPHVPPGSREFESTRIIRVARDYMYSGDLSPAYSNVYPEILEPFVDEDRFRQVVKTVNDGLYIAHSPWAVKNIVDGVVGMLTLWIYEDVVDTEAKKRIADVEEYLQDVNEELAKEGMGARFIPLRRTGYLTMDIQIPDPGIGFSEDEDSDSDSDAQQDEHDDNINSVDADDADDEAHRRHLKMHLEGIGGTDRPPALMVNGQYA